MLVIHTTSFRVVKDLDNRIQTPHLGLGQQFHSLVGLLVRVDELDQPAMSSPNLLVGGRRLNPEFLVVVHCRTSV